MIEKIRITLWDVFTFFLTGFLVAAVGFGIWAYQNSSSAADLLVTASKLPASVVLFAAPLFFTLVGLLVEPFANYFDRWVLSNTLGRLMSQKDRHTQEESTLLAEIRENHLAGLGGKIANPFHLCKDYVESKSLSPTFMIFLARYGFYRNCAFIAVIAGVYGVFSSQGACARLCVGVTALFGVYIFKKRAEDFYSYQAPAVYRAFLIDKLDWSRKAVP